MKAEQTEPKRITAGPAVRAKCLDCLRVETGRMAYDCLVLSCPLYPAMPWRGKLMPKTIRPEDGKVPAEEQVRIEIAKTIARRRPSKALIVKKCRECYPTVRRFCGVPSCPLARFNPYRDKDPEAGKPWIAG